MALDGIPVEQVRDKIQLVYETLKELSTVDEIPCGRQNARRALASVWQIVNDLGLPAEELTDYGI